MAPEVPRGDSPSAPGEFEIIRDFFQRQSADADVLLGIGDDAALLQVSGSIAVATDTLVAGVHFLAGMSPARLAQRALAVNLSDMAAMGAQPRWFTLALTLPNADVDWLSAFSMSLHASAGEYQMTLIGGDLTRGPLTITLQLIGTVPAELALRRDGARSGDLVFVTGTVGDAAGGLRLLQQQVEIDDRASAKELIDRFECPTPRVSAGIALRGIASAAIDISDGLSADLARLCAASGCGARVDMAKLPISDALQACFGKDASIEMAMTGGDDYELLFTAAPAERERVIAALSLLDVTAACIGECIAGNAVNIYNNGRYISAARPGYTHF